MSIYDDVINEVVEEYSAALELLLKTEFDLEPDPRQVREDFRAVLSGAMAQPDFVLNYGTEEWDKRLYAEVKRATAETRQIKG